MAFQISGHIIQTKTEGREYKVLCPFHGDVKPSLSINPDKGVYHCLGCGRKGRLDVEEREIEATYDYRDKDGNFLYQVVRYHPKDFVQRRRVNGEWVYSLDNTPGVLYRLPEVITANDPVVIVEGENSVDCLRRYGVNATTNPHGAGKWQKKHNDYLKGRKVLIIPDNDSQGIEHAEAILKSLQVIGDVQIQFLPDLKDKEDVFDYLQSHSIGDLRQLISPVT